MLGRTGTLPYIGEMFIDFVHLESATGVKIEDAIRHSLAQRGLDITQVRGQSYDGASAMSTSKV